MTDSAESVAQRLTRGAEICADELLLAPGGCGIRVRSSSSALTDRLRDYFFHVVADAIEPEIEVIAIDRDAPDTGLTFLDWKREPGKQGRKDAYAELPDGRVIRKVRTGMLFLQSDLWRVACGPCLEYDNQVINFINSQYMNWLQHRGWLICHAAALAYRGHGLGIAGFSGGGKSTLMLRLLDHDGVSYLTNDRLFLLAGANGVTGRGIPKLPRINPGTIVHNPGLHALIPADRRAELLRLPADELWHLEEKHDVHIDRLYGRDRIVQEIPLTAMLLLNWQRDAREAPEIRTVELSQRRELLSAVMKSPGPFYRYPDGRFLRDTDVLDEQAWLDALSHLTVYEVRGRIDFDAMAQACLDTILV